MNPSVGTVLSRRDRALLATVAIAPFAFYFAVKLLGYSRYLTLAVLGAVALAGATAVFLRPRAGLWLLLFYVYIGSPFPGAAAPLAVLAFVGVVLGLVRGEKNRLDDPLFWYANAFLILIALGSILFAQVPMLALEEMGRYGKILLVTCLIVQLVQTPEALRRMTMVVFVGAVSTVLLGLLYLAAGVDLTHGRAYVGGDGAMYMARFSGGHANPNLAAAVMCSALPLGIFGLKHAPPRHRIFFMLGIAALVVAMFATFSRSVVFPFAFIVGAMVVHESRSRRTYLALAILLALAVLLAPRVYWERVLGLREALESTADWSVYTRLLALQTAWEMFLDHPLTGVGIGNFIMAASYKLFVRMVAHNTYLEILVGTGIFGLLSFCAVLFSGLRHSLTGLRHRWRQHPAWLRSASFYWMLSAVSIGISAFFGSMPFRYFLWVPVAAGLVIGNLLREDRRGPAR